MVSRAFLFENKCIWNVVETHVAFKSVRKIIKI